MAEGRAEEVNKRSTALVMSDLGEEPSNKRSRVLLSDSDDDAGATLRSGCYIPESLQDRRQRGARRRVMVAFLRNQEQIIESEVTAHLRGQSDVTALVTEYAYPGKHGQVVNFKITGGDAPDRDYPTRLYEDRTLCSFRQIMDVDRPLMPPWLETWMYVLQSAQTDVIGSSWSLLEVLGISPESLPLFTGDNKPPSAHILRIACTNALDEEIDFPPEYD